MDTKVRNKKLDEGEFLRERKEVLAMWPTGKEVDLEEAVEFHKKLPDHKTFGRLRKAAPGRQNRGFSGHNAHPGTGELN